MSENPAVSPVHLLSSEDSRGVCPGPQVHLVISYCLSLLVSTSCLCSLQGPSRFSKTQWRQQQLNSIDWELWANTKELQSRRRNFKWISAAPHGTGLPHHHYLSQPPLTKASSTAHDQDRSSLLEGCPITSSPIPGIFFKKENHHQSVPSRTKDKLIPRATFLLS